MNSANVLTARERQIVQLIADECSSKEIASTLHLSCETINSHRKNAMSKLNARNTAGLVRRAIEARIIDLKL